MTARSAVQEAAPLVNKLHTSRQTPTDGSYATYAGAGVDIEAGEKAVDRIKHLAASTYTPEVVSALGGFGGMCRLPSGIANPVLVSTMDGVGTKSLIAQAVGRYDTIGIDLVAMLVDDLVCQGASPLFLLDYIAIAELRPDQMEALVSGVAEGCRQARCALIGGEMAEHPQMTAPDFDLAGSAVGIVDESHVIDGTAVKSGDVVLGLVSPGLRCNGYSLARHVLLEKEGVALGGEAWTGAGRTWGDVLLEPSLIYSAAVADVLRQADLHAVVHVTGGGIGGNTERMLQSDVDVIIDRDAWEVPQIFREIARRGPVADAEMVKVFNMGIGMVLIAEPSAVPVIETGIAAHGIEVRRIGRVVHGSGRVQMRGWSMQADAS